MIEFIYEGDNICRIKADTISGIQPMINAFRVENPAKFFVEQYGSTCDQYLNCISPIGKFRAGLFPRVYKMCVDLYGKDNIKVDKEISNVLFPLKKYKLDYKNPHIMPSFKLNDEMEERDYQLYSVSQMMRYSRGLLSIPTRGGKSIIISIYLWNLITQMNIKHAIILVPSVQLVHQFYKDMIKFGYNESQLSKFTAKGGTKDHNTIIITNKQYLLKHIDELPKQIDCIIADEVHEIKEGSKTFSFLESLDTNIKFGCSGSIPKIDDDDNAKKYQRLCLESLFGCVVHKKTIKELQDEGWISKLNIHHIYIHDNEIDRNKRKYTFSLDPCHLEDQKFNDAYNHEVDYFKDNAVRLYKPVIEMLPTIDNNLLILFDRTDLGVSIFDEITRYLAEINSDKRCFFIDGKTDIDVREEIRESSELCDTNIIVAQVRCFSTGLTVNNLHNVMYMFRSKAESTLLQSIGRSLGLHKSKTHATLYDISFNTKYSTKHYNERLGTYLEEYHKSKMDKEIIMEI